MMVVGRTVQQEQLSQVEHPEQALQEQDSPMVADVVLFETVVSFLLF